MSCATFDQPAALRMACRTGEFRDTTMHQVTGYQQANLVVLPHVHAPDFLLFCRRNPKACPLIEVMAPGARTPACAAGADIATDLPGYRIYRDGALAAETHEIASLWRDDFVVFLIAGSFSFEWALIDAGIPLRHISERRTVPMYRTSMPCVPAGGFRGEVVVSMRPIRSRDIVPAIEVSSRFPMSHGAPLHVGNPACIGIHDLRKPDYGDPIDVLEDELPVFWACGITPQWVVQQSRLPLCITHVPGKMLVTDLKG